MRSLTRFWFGPSFLFYGSCEKPFEFSDSWESFRFSCHHLKFRCGTLHCAPNSSHEHSTCDQVENSCVQPNRQGHTEKNLNSCNLTPLFQSNRRENQFNHYLKALKCASNFLYPIHMISDLGHMVHSQANREERREWIVARFKGERDMGWRGGALGWVPAA